MDTLEQLWYLFRYNIPQFIKNIIWFRKELWTFSSGDYSHNLDIFKRSLEYTVRDYEDFTEAKTGKVVQMDRVIELLDRQVNDKYLDLAEQQLNKTYRVNTENFLANVSPGEQEVNKQLIILALELEKTDWAELWSIIQGDASKSGSDIRNWWI
jgi:hypothetical protein